MVVRNSQIGVMVALCEQLTRMIEQDGVSRYISRKSDALELLYNFSDLAATLTCEATNIAAGLCNGTFEKKKVKVTA